MSYRTRCLIIALLLAGEPGAEAKTVTAKAGGATMPTSPGGGGLIRSGRIASGEMRGQPSQPDQPEHPFGKFVGKGG